MAVNVDTVYKTVLSILNKEQRGYMTPSEFNKTAAHVQLEIFNEYLDTLNALLKNPQYDLNYANKISSLDEKLAIFKSETTLSQNVSGLFVVPDTVIEIGSVVYNSIEIERLQKSEFYNINKSDLTKPSINYPVYLYEGNSMKIYPTTITSNVLVNFIRIPIDPTWGFALGSRGQYVFDPSTSVSKNFELHEKERTNIVMRILMYSGVIIKDQQIVQMAAQQVQAEQINSKA